MEQLGWFTTGLRLVVRVHVYLYVCAYIFVDFVYASNHLCYYGILCLLRAYVLTCLWTYMYIFAFKVTFMFFYVYMHIM